MVGEGVPEPSRCLGLKGDHVVGTDIGQRHGNMRSRL